MFGRKSSTPQVVEPTEPETPAKTVGKGRPTPTRKEAEAARKARLKPARTRKEQQAARAGEAAKMREAMKTGDERYLPARDKGPVKRFVRDWIDARFTFAEIVLPIMIVALIVPYVSASIGVYAELFVLVVLAVVVVNLAVMMVMLRKELKRRFAGQSLAGTTYYAIMRAVQLRPLRLPKPQVRIGEQLSDDYR